MLKEHRSIRSGKARGSIRSAVSRALNYCEALETRRMLNVDLAVGLFNNEPNIAVNPQNIANVVVVDVNRLKISNDGGATFPITVNTQPAAGQAAYSGSGDDVLAFDAQG